jgi:hypothetical protein
MKQILVFAVDGRSLPFDGGVGRFVGRDKTGAARADGDLVPASSYYIRAIARGDVTVAPGGEKENAS